jgi:peptide methionine sulfoxide reductase msrA/msrB
MLNKSKSLMPELLQIIHDKGTERPFTGVYDDFDGPGTYLCRQCGLGLFRAQHKFHSGCGWPSFDQGIGDNVRQIPDADHKRTEILCARCDAHLGHVFMGERFTPLNTRHCVNSASLEYVPSLDVQDTEEAIFAAGCFWGVEYYFKKLPGVLKVESGYTGGHKSHPTYEQICTGTTGHYEAIRVIYDVNKTSYEAVTQYFFEIHDATQTNGQGPDLGQQYLSAIFYYDDEQKSVAESTIHTLTKNGYKIATKLLPVAVFWPAEDYHQDYYAKTGKAPYCHRYEKIF